MSNFVESGRVPRYEDQQRPRMRPAHDSLGFEDDFFLSAVRAPGNPHGARYRVKLPQAATTRADVLRHAEIKLDVARDVRAIGISAQRHEAIGVPRALRGDNNSS